MSLAKVVFAPLGSALMMLMKEKKYVWGSAEHLLALYWPVAVFSKLMCSSCSPLKVVQTCSILNSDLFSRSDPVLFRMVRNEAARFSSSLNQRTSRGVPRMKKANTPTVMVRAPRNKEIPLHLTNVSKYTSKFALS
jgi:hypothetical protein